MPSILRRGLLAALALVLFLPTAHAQDGDRAKRRADALDLTDAQTNLVAAALADPEPGDLWELAAALAPTLTAEQKEKLFARPERPGQRGQHRLLGPNGDTRGERQRPDAEELRDERADEMRAALGLTDAQVQQLDALHAERQAEREARRADRPEPGEVGPDLAAILSPEQEEVVAVHRALAVRLMRARHHGRRGR